MTARFDLTGYIGEGNATSEAVGQFLSTNPGPVLVVVNSAGGSATDGAAIAAELARHGQVECLVQGVAASAASYVTIGANSILMHTDAVLMIHEPSAFVGGTSGALRDAADILEKLSGIYAAGYARATGQPVARIAAWMAAETWLSADEALALNFCDGIEGTQQGPTMVAAHDYSTFKAAPAHLVQMAQQNGWVTTSPETGKRKSKP